MTISSASALAPIKTRAIPRNGEKLPVIGLGTWQTFDVGNNATSRESLGMVLGELTAQGASVVDSSPMYGSSESVVGELSDKLHLDSKLFKATKVWTKGRDQGVAQMRESMRRMNTSSMDLMQVHNLLDAETHLQTLNDWKQQGLVRFTGLTHYHSGGYAEMKRLMLKHEVDFIQINYSILTQGADKEILRIAQDRGVAVLINRPFESGSVFSRIAGKQLPSWASEFDCASWGQFFLKFILANPAVTCVIHGTSKLKHLRDNLQAGRGSLPSPEHVKAMIDYMTA